MMACRHGSWAKISGGGNGMWLKNPIRRSGPRLAQHPRHQLQLVVLDPDGGAVVRMAYDGVREPFG